ncbi:hlh transcription factor [Sporothrix brasiliensis 5110]|uniref:Hlh transcription factor n=1 Tax=Sporothrix brasiliensis 5110 TaxID=1398154 RepID=A0A0C2F7C5_9PEZI|nr:hlh transcription factor [Sporothrix brasiliensis 5110]KIH86973.1 hlh transcription factor [Sporothrix brasiliensis 5110]
MAMMGSSAWNGQDQAMHPAGDEEFQQFLDMNGMGNLTDNIQFDFTDFQNASPGASQLIHTTMAPASEPLDTPMTGAHHAPALLAQATTGQLSDAGLTGTAGIHPGSHTHGMNPVVTTGGGSHASNPTTLMPSVTPTDAISEIDAQIQYLQQQRMQQQQRQVEEQNIAFFQRQNHIVPPTPQSLELQAGNQFFHSPDPRNQQHQQQQQQQQHPSQQSQQQAMYERYQHYKEQQDMSFTPLVSPAVTPLETQFSIDTQFTVPGAYFSPLTSPALHAQTDPNSTFDPRLNTSSTSPLDMDMEMLPAAAPASSNSTSVGDNLAKKARKNNASKARKANVRQSPITKPMRKKSTTTPVMNAQVLDQLAESLEHEALSSPVIRQQSQQQAFPSNARLTPSHGHVGGPSSSSAGTTDSENDSVSPENLTDMPPPPLPKPRSARPSPYLHPQNHSSAAPNHNVGPATSAPGPAMAGAALAGGFPSPATPASLMKLSSPKQKSHKSSPSVTPIKRDGTASGSNSVGGGATTAVGVANEQIENFELPESLSMDFQKTHVTSSSAHNTPSIETTASPSLDPIAGGRGFQPLPSPSIAKLGGGTRSATQSPQILPGSSSTPILAAGSNRKTPQMLPRGSSSKKRPSISSVQVSPALRPKISPSIKPLLPGGVSSVEDQASRLLATKSNYQNILEGNTVPGVSYPSELSTNLTSKRTSHKIAEQGRRNRINSALQEIATLLPTPPPKDTKAGDAAAGGDDDEVGGGDAKKDGKPASGGGGNNSAPNSKASTVEMAIEYIKLLKKEVADLTKRAEDAEAKLQLKVEETS